MAKTQIPARVLDAPEVGSSQSAQPGTREVRHVHYARKPSHPREFFRTMWGDNPKTEAELRRLEYLYGSNLLFMNDATHRATQVDGTVLHADPDWESEYWFGSRNPARAAAELEDKLGDKLEEYRFLADNAPECAPVTVRLDEIARDLGIESLRTSNPREFLVRLQEELGKRYGKYIIKPREGYGSDGRLPTHKDDFGELWDGFQRELVPERERLSRRLADPDELMEQLYEEAPYAEGLALEQLLADPSQVLVQQFVDAVNELRVHVVEGKILKGATVGRWFDWKAFTSPKQIRQVELAVEKLLTNAAEQYPGARMGFTMDVLVERNGGVKIIDLNPGYQSGMYYAEWELFIPHLLAEHFRGTESEFLHRYRELQRAPLDQKLPLAQALVKDVGGYVRKNDGSGLYERLVEAYLVDVAHDRPTPAKLKEAFHQLSQLAGIEAYFLYQLLQDPRVRPALDDLTLAEAHRIMATLARLDDEGTWELVDPKTNDGMPFVRTELPEETEEAEEADEAAEAEELAA